MQPSPLLNLRLLPYSVWSFFRDVGPLLALCIGASLLVALVSMTLAERLVRKAHTQHWLAENRATLQKVMLLGYFANALGRKLPPCGNCGQSKYHLWNCGKHLVVFRCSHCRYTYSLSAFSYPESRHILHYMPALQVVQIWLNKYRRGAIGRHLLKLCKPVEAYCRRRLSWGEEGE